MMNETSPISKNPKAVIVDRDPATGLISKLCMDSGYTTNSFLKEDSQTVEQLKGKVPQVVQSNTIKPGDGFIWIPMMQSSPSAALIPVAVDDGSESFSWHVIPLQKLTEEEIAEQQQILQSRDDYDEEAVYDTFAVFEDAVVFNREDFPLAFEHFMSYVKNDPELLQFNDEEE